MNFSRENLIDLVYEEKIHGMTIVERNLVTKSRWTIYYGMVFEFEGKFYKSKYSVGATEMQCEDPYEYEPEMIECEEVVPVEVTTIEYWPLVTNEFQSI